jgi:O-antigen ligase
MLNHFSLSSRIALLISLAGVGVGVVAGFTAGAQPLYLGVALGAIAITIYFFAKFEQAVISLLVVRSSLDIFTTSGIPSTLKQIPATFALGLDALILLYVTVLLLTGRRVRTDKFWWVFAGWIALQGLWLILLALGGLGLDASFLPASVREWVRLFSLLMVYLLVMQLIEKLTPEKIVSLLFLSLISPITVALMQIFLPSVITQVIGDGDGGVVVSEGARIYGTFGHPNSFAVYLLLFIGLTWWKLGYSKRRLPWLLLLGLLVFVLSTTKTLIALVMLFTFIIFMIAPKLSLANLIGGVLLFAVVIGLFVSSQLGQQRLAGIANTPLLNPNIDISRAILLSQSDYNSFNWRLAQWDHLIHAWQQFPIFGYGLGLSNYVSTNNLLPHNDYIRALVEGGVVGLGILLIFFAAQIVRLVQLIRRTPSGSVQQQLCFILLAIFIATPIGMLSENIAICTAFYFYYWTAFAVAGWRWNEIQTLDKNYP